MTKTYVNKFGRKQTRGIRPYLLIPKIVFVAMAVGGFAAMLALGVGVEQMAGEPAVQRVAAVRGVFYRVTLPGLIGSMVFGVLLFLQMPWTFLKLRWMRVKLVMIVVGIPVLHVAGRLLMHTNLVGLNKSGSVPRQAWLMFEAVLVAALVLLVGLVVVGRQKPRFGQNWAKDFRKLKTARGITAEHAKDAESGDVDNVKETAT